MLTPFLLRNLVGFTYETPVMQDVCMYIIICIICVLCVRVCINRSNMHNNYIVVNLSTYPL